MDVIMRWSSWLHRSVRSCFPHSTLSKPRVNISVSMSEKDKASTLASSWSSIKWLRKPVGCLTGDRRLVEMTDLMRKIQLIRLNFISQRFYAYNLLNVCDSLHTITARFRAEWWWELEKSGNSIFALMLPIKDEYLSPPHRQRGRRFSPATMDSHSIVYLL